MSDVIKSAALYTVYALAVGAALQGVIALAHVGGAASEGALRIAAAFFAVG
ncbi:MAG: hypothetical protein K2Q06_16150 [Parvularculaceae bacterium]|nr:hypothetical protein [Parvularculaceae bacterium]